MSYLDDPRVLFAAERTLLAWNRTAVGLITLGFVIERFGLFLTAMDMANTPGQRDFSFFIGMALIALASLLSLVSIVQFRRVVRRLSEQEIPPGYALWCGTAANLTLAILGVLLIVYLVRGFG